MEQNYSQLIVGVAEGRGTGTNHNWHSYTDAWRTVVLSNQQKIIPPPHLILYSGRNRTYVPMMMYLQLGFFKLGTSLTAEIELLLFHMQE